MRFIRGKCFYYLCTVYTNLIFSSIIGLFSNNTCVLFNSYTIDGIAVVLKLYYYIITIIIVYDINSHGVIDNYHKHKTANKLLSFKS